MASDNVAVGSHQNQNNENIVNQSGWRTGASLKQNASFEITASRRKMLPPQASPRPSSHAAAEQTKMPTRCDAAANEAPPPVRWAARSAAARASLSTFPLCRRRAGGAAAVGSQGLAQWMLPRRRARTRDVAPLPRYVCTRGRSDPIVRLMPPTTLKPLSWAPWRTTKERGGGAFGL